MFTGTLPAECQTSSRERVRLLCPCSFQIRSDVTPRARDRYAAGGRYCRGLGLMPCGDRFVNLGVSMKSPMANLLG